MDLAQSPKIWDPSFPDMPVGICEHGLVFVNAVKKFYLIGGITTTNTILNTVYTNQYPNPTAWTPSGSFKFPTLL